jgi:hypothetical protein
VADDVLAAAEGLLARYPDAQTWVVRIGHAAVHRIGRRTSRGMAWSFYGGSRWDATNGMKTLGIGGASAYSSDESVGVVFNGVVPVLPPIARALPLGSTTIS